MNETSRSLEDYEIFSVLWVVVARLPAILQENSAKKSSQSQIG